MSATVNVNGRVCDQEHAVIPVFDHGFLYGEGVYETLRTYNGRPVLFDRIGAPEVGVDRTCGQMASPGRGTGDGAS